LYDWKVVHFLSIFRHSDRAEVLPSRNASSGRGASCALGGIARGNAISQVLCAIRKTIPPIDFDYPHSGSVEAIFY
jgi:hypothetical protein